MEEKNEVCERWEQFFGRLLNVGEEKNSVIKASPEIGVRYLEKAGQNPEVHKTH